MVGALAQIQISPALVSGKRKKVALVFAVLADLVQLGYFPLFGEGVLSIPEDVLDATVALLLIFTLGFHWRLALAFAIELVPGAALFPSWTAVVLSLPTLSPRETSTSSPPPRPQLR